jgi:hypothetical protein
MRPTTYRPGKVDTALPFEEFDKRAASASKSPFVTVRKDKGFTLNRAAYKLLGEPDAVTLLYDEEEHLIGFKPASPTFPRAYPVRPQPKGTAVSVAGRAFGHHYGIDTSITRRYAVEMQDGVLVLDLDSESTEIEGPWTRRQERETV